MKQLQRIAGRLVLALFGLLVAHAAVAAGCDGAAYRQFDFWLGDWEVRTLSGKVAGTNRIKAEYDGCVIHERYETGSGYRGESLNTYDSGRKLWHQTWVDNNGRLLLLEGGLRDGNMVLQGQASDPDGKMTRHRISWTPRADGTVTQLWEALEGEGQWSVVFYGIYWRK